MSTIRSKVANALSFAHLAGFAGKARAEGDDPEDPEKKKKDEEAAAGAAKAEGEDDERKKRDDESDDEYSARMKAMDEEDEKKKDEEAKANDDSDEEMRGNSTAAAARRRERARCAAIFGSAAAGKNPVLAANLAFNTSMTRTEALAVLDATPAPVSASNLSRAARNPNVGVDGTKQSPQQVAAARWDHNLQAAAKSGRR
ncbi:MAG TPA: hypothetical protein VIQ29_13540 [Ancylobacter sp.]